MFIKKINMLRYTILLLPVLLFADNKKMHDEDPKNRPHNTLGFGVLGSVYINDDQIFITSEKTRSPGFNVTCWLI